MNDINDDYIRKHAEERANFISKITFFWLIDLFKLGQKYQITANDDIFGIRRDDASAKLSKIFSALWKSELSNGGNSLWRVIRKVYGLRVAFCGLTFSIVDTIFRLLQPQFLGAFISFFVPNQTSVSTSQAIYFAAGTISCSLIPVLVFHPFFLYTLNIGQRIRIACCSLLYKKVLKLSKNSTQFHIIVTNLISRDMNKLDYAIATCHEIYRIPLEALFIAYFIYKETGIVGLFGIISMIAFVPLLFYIIKRSTIYRLRAAQHTESRVHLMGEIIKRIATIKTFCMEQIYAKMIKERRLNEIEMVRGVLYLRATSVSLNFLLKFSIFVCIASALSWDNHLNASSVYIVISYYTMLFTSMLQFWPLLVTNAMDAYHTIERVQEVLLTFNISNKKEEKDSSEISQDVALTEKLMPDQKSKSAQRRINEESDIKGIQIKNLITQLNVKCNHLEINENKSYALVNSASTLIEVLIGEVEIESGDIEINGSISYASKSPWIFAGSIRENITFTEQFDVERYSMILKLFEIEKEIQALPNGDDTLVDEFCLSDSFKMRIHLARCLYRNADIYVIDNCFSDIATNQVAEAFEKIFKNKISLIATNQQHVINQTSEIISVQDNSINIIGLSKDFTLSETKNTNEDCISTEITRKQSSNSFVVHQENSENQISESIEWSSYRKYLKSISGSKCGILWLIILFIFAQLNTSGLELFISKWLNHVEMVPYRHVLSVNFTAKNNNSTFRENEAFVSNYDNWVNFVYFYSIILCTLLYFTVHRSFLFFKLCLRASVLIHDRLFCGITRATMRFFQCNSLRQILNHFTADIEKLDNQVPITIYDSIAFLFETVGIFILITLVNYWLLLPTLILLFAVFTFRSCYTDTARSLRRVESLTHNSIHSRLISTFHGLSTIRSTHSEKILMDEFHRNMDLNTSAMYLNLAATRAFALWLDIMCCVYICVVILSFLLFKSEGIRQTVEVGHNMISVEKIFRYQYITTEPQFRTPNKHRPSKNWPQSAKIIFNNFHLRYTSSGNDVLKDLSFKIHSGEKIGIVGETKTGKSSIVQALLRFAFNEGTIEIDDINIETLGIHDLRRCFGIIPQNPILFEGSIRCNLDPLEQNTDENIWNALERVGIKENILNVVGGLSSSANEQILNVKKMQLFYIARAFLAKNKILILDETTDVLKIDDANEIQDVIRRNFSNCTIMVISQRLESIMDCDNIIVLDDGRIVEFGHPYELIQISRGQFRSMIDRTGYANAMNLIKMAERSYFTKKTLTT
ncbi:hypothetical protein PVAND_000155 [Polypedilum vanderplanki]|uniref:Uncharacterized protein n=1 Tax=Polypedilum vanderplanki TaxID=319348 RepID=A0A9J6BJI1_POLVA|nr:hypothetical protein PVAND_000155 [Polypedilum vanderplanki]